ncbi:MAG: phage tail sheath protein, partial [Treponema sp.]|nr:phage tail sheath protein [Treponema sp.]
MKQIPNNLLVPGQYEEIDNSLAGAQGDIKKVLLVGYKTATAPAVTGKPLQVLSWTKAAEQAGYGSPLAIMAEAFLSINKIEECWILPVAEPETGSKWQKPFTLAVTTAGAGYVDIIVNGKILSAPVSAGAAADEVAAAIVARINSEDNLPVEAAAEDSIVTVASTVKGQVGNQNTVSMISAASGVSIENGDPIPGVGAAEVKSLYAGLGGSRYNYFVFDFDDTANIQDLAAELEDRYSALRQIGGRAFIALSGDVGSATEAGSILAQVEAVNSPHILLVPRLNNPQLPCEWAARFAAAACRILADDPAANTYDVQVNGLEA